MLSVYGNDIVVAVVQIYVFDIELTCRKVDYVGGISRSVKQFDFKFGQILNVNRVIAVIVFDIVAACVGFGSVFVSLNVDDLPAIAVLDVP